MSLTEVCTRGIVSPARNVLSTTLPVSTALSLVRTNAPPLPGLTCWNSTMRQMTPSTSTCMPFLNWFVEIVSAICLSRVDQRFGELREHLVPAFGHRDQVLDANAEATRKVHARLDGHDVPWFEHPVDAASQAWLLVDCEPDAVAGPVPEVLTVAGLGDDPPRRLVHVRARRARPHQGERRL